MKQSIKILNPNQMTDKEAIIQHIKNNRMVSHLGYLPEDLKGDKDIFKEAVKAYMGALSYANDTLRNDRDFCLELLKIEPFCVCGFSDKIKDDIFIIEKSLSYSKDKVVSAHNLADICSKRISNLFKNTTFVKEITDKLLKAIEMEENGFRINEDDFNKQVETYELLMSLENSNKNTPKKIKI